MRFAYPYALILLLLMPLLLWLRRRRLAPATVAYSSIAPLAIVAPSPWVRLSRYLPALRGLALLLCILALAQPQWGFETTKLRREGIAIDMIVDISKSMSALDLQIDGEARNRLQVVKRAFRSFVQGDAALAGRKGDLIGLVTFARYADSVSPLTLDHGTLLAALSQVEMATLPEDNGTAIGEGIALGVERLRNSATKSRVMILLTDGANNAGFAEPLEAAQIAKALGIRIYTIGAGTQGTAPVEMRMGDGSVVIQNVPVAIDETVLDQIARHTGGRYFRATDGEALQTIYKEIDRLEKTAAVVEHYQQYVDYFPWFLLAALGLLIAEAVLVNTRLRTVP
ncbi:MAG: VWA domain-containing protein [Gammaproteobacteria bacterium]